MVCFLEDEMGYTSLIAEKDNDLSASGIFYNSRIFEHIYEDIIVFESESKDQSLNMPLVHLKNYETNVEFVFAEVHLVEGSTFSK